MTRNPAQAYMQGRNGAFDEVEKLLLAELDKVDMFDVIARSTLLRILDFVEAAKSKKKKKES
jgi:hypothetical protein